jgi:hypothetical protein
LTLGDTAAEHLEDHGVGAELRYLFECEAEGPSYVLFQDGGEDLGVLTFPPVRAAHMRQCFEAACLGLLVVAAPGVGTNRSQMSHGPIWLAAGGIGGSANGVEPFWCAVEIRSGVR